MAQKLADWNPRRNNKRKIVDPAVNEYMLRIRDGTRERIFSYAVLKIQ